LQAEIQELKDRPVTTSLAPLEVEAQIQYQKVTFSTIFSILVTTVRLSTIFSILVTVVRFSMIFSIFHDSVDFGHQGQIFYDDQNFGHQDQPFHDFLDFGHHKYICKNLRCTMLTHALRVYLAEPRHALDR
jgi:hypothetical protein